MVYRLASRLTLTLGYTFALASIGPGLALGHEYQALLLGQSRPEPPPRLPPNRTRPGGGLDPAKQACKANDQALTALVPEENPVLSASPYPTFLFYIPDAPEDITSIEFSLFTSDEKQRIFSTRFVPEQIPGVVAVSIPARPEYALKSDKLYRWYFKVNCSGDTSDSRDLLTVDGWINQVNATAEHESQINAVSPEVWYDSLALVASHLQASPDHPTWRSHWTTLLESVGLEDLATANVSDVSDPVVDD